MASQITQSVQKLNLRVAHSPTDLYQKNKFLLFAIIMTATCFDKTNYSSEASPTYDLSNIPQLESFY